MGKAKTLPSPPLSILKPFLKWEILKKIIASLQKGKIWIRGVGGTSLSLLLASLYLLTGKRILVVSEEEEGETLYSDLKEIIPERVFNFPSIYRAESNLRGERERLCTLHALLAPHPVVVIASPISMAEILPTPQEVKEKSLYLKVGQRRNREEILHSFLRLGYERTYEVEIPGEFSVRGGILDIFPPSEENPLRIELGEESIVSLRVFDPLTQKSLYSLKETHLLPARIPERRKGEGGNLLDFLDSGDILVLHESPHIKERIKALSSLSENAQYLPWSQILKNLSGRKIILTSWIPQRPALKFEELFSLSFQPIKGLIPNWEEMVKNMKKWKKEGMEVFLSGFGEMERARIEEILKHRGISEGWEIVEANLKEGFLSSSLKMVVLTQQEMVGYHPPSRRKERGYPLLTPFDLKPGDYVVHLIHGIGRFLGLREEKLGGRRRELMVIEYEGGNLLYVPVESLQLVEKYVGIGDEPPKLSRLGGTRWRRTKEKVARAVKDLASELLYTQALREVSKGFAFSPDNVWQKEFESLFPYEETPDQKKAIDEVKRDMEHPSPMDRLVCGDAGFGKTEVAIRAAFKAVMDGKQVAVLVPTTLLAQQHYLNFKARLQNFSVRVEVLSRFQKPSRIKEILRELEEGKVDIVIGTHRLLQEDVNFKDLGLLIIDEEQRFGVRHKEKIKLLKRLVDVLTLSATPIPRTLYLSLVGVKDISLISTPPPERLDVETIIREFDPPLIQEVIRKEMERGGQVFYVHNRVEEIPRIKEYLRKLVPEARISVAHGQMKSRELEKVMIKFLNKEVDVLLTTTIIASGLDIPNANTIIINNAHKFGLADLYQLRGRVGRYKVKAYAYLLIPSHQTLSSEARRRLYAIQEFSYLGSSYQLAVQDLQIRGAGNILGEEQHGHIQAVGLQLYTELLSRAIAEIKGETFLPRIMTQVELGIPLSFPPTYIGEEREKLLFYKRISDATREEEIENIREELEDRFGKLPPSVENLLQVQRIKIRAFKAGIEHIRRKNETLYLRYSPNISLKEKAEQLHQLMPGRVFITPQGEIGIILKKGKEGQSPLSFLLQLLNAPPLSPIMD